MLRRAYWLFRLMSHPWLVSAGQGLARVLLKARFPVEGIIRATVFRQFCGGETIDECRLTIERLGKYGVGTILDYSIEGIQNEGEFDSTCAEIRRTIDLASGDPLIPFSVFKTTGIARHALLAKKNAHASFTADESAEWQRARERFLSLCKHAHEKNVRIFVDAEESWLQDAIDDLALEAIRKFNRTKAIVYQTVQMYRVDRYRYLEGLLGTARAEGFFPGIKLVRGAYMEKERAFAQRLGRPSPIHPDKSATDADYDRALKLCVEHKDRVSLCAGTHNERSTQRLMQLASENGIADRDARIYYSQLLGMSDHLSFNLAAAGYNVAKYVPYGPLRAMMPYLFRRAEENTAILGQTPRELELIRRELDRRRSD